MLLYFSQTFTATATFALFNVALQKRNIKKVQQKLTTLCSIFIAVFELLVGTWHLLNFYCCVLFKLLLQLQPFLLLNTQTTLFNDAKNFVPCSP